MPVDLDTLVDFVVEHLRAHDVGVESGSVVDDDDDGTRIGSIRLNDNPEETSRLAVVLLPSWLDAKDPPIVAFRLTIHDLSIYRSVVCSHIDFVNEALSQLVDDYKQTQQGRS